MPEGAPPPAASASPTLISGASTTGTAAEVQAGLQAWSGSGNIDNRAHQTFPGTQLHGNGLLNMKTNFTGERLVVQNMGPQALYVNTNSATATSDGGGYEFLVPGFSLLSARVPQTNQVTILPLGEVGLTNAFSVDVYLLAGVFAAQGPDLSILPLSPLGAQIGGPNVAHASGTGTGAQEVPTWNVPATGVDPFSGAGSFIADAVLVQCSPSTAGTAGGGNLWLPIAPQPTGGFLLEVPFEVPAGAGGAAGPVSSLTIPGPFPIGGPSQPVQFEADAGATVNITVVYH